MLSSNVILPPSLAKEESAIVLDKAEIFFKGTNQTHLFLPLFLVFFSNLFQPLFKSCKTLSWKSKGRWFKTRHMWSHWSSTMNLIHDLYRQSLHTRLAPTHFRSFKIRRATFLNEISFVDLLILRLWNCEKVGRAWEVVSTQQYARVAYLPRFALNFLPKIQLRTTRISWNLIESRAEKKRATHESMKFL